jgi:hypothetical protein
MMDTEKLFGATEKSTEPNDNTVDDVKFHKDIMETYNKAVKTWEDIRTTYEYNVRFALLNEQWTEDERSKRAAMGRSITTNNRLAANIRYVVNNFKANPPAIKIHPRGSNANKNTSEVLDGIIKYIQYTSDANEAYSNALMSVCAGGMGAWRVIPRIYDHNKNDVELVIERIRDVLSVVIDPGAKNPNFSDMEYCFITNRISRDQFEREFPDEKDNEDPINSEAGWGDKEFVQISEFWRRIDGKVEQYIFNGSKILYKNTEYPGTLIPVIFVVGEDISIGQDRKIKSLISDVIDQQKILNYTKSEIVDAIQKTTKTKYLVDYNALSTPELQRMWNSINADAFPYLPYDGKNGAKPDTITPGTIPSEYIEGSKEASEDIQFGMGIPNPLTDIPTTQSGKAISLQLSQKNLQTYNFINNINLGIRYTGEILLDLIRYYYDSEDIMQILGVDGQVNQVPVNTEYQENGKIEYHDLTKSAEYKCMVSIGPSYTDKRSEMLDIMTTLSQQMPIIGQTAADLIIGNMDFDNADSIARRIRAGMDPKILAATNPTNNDSETMAANNQALQNQMAQSQAQMEQMQQVIQQLQGQLQIATDSNNLKMQMEQMKYQHETEMEVLKTKFRREDDVYKMQIDEQKAENEYKLKTESEMVKEKQKLAHEVAIKQHDHTLASATIDQKHKNDLEKTVITNITNLGNKKQ